MAGHEVNFWTFTGLVGAYLDLGIAYFLLCASTLAFLGSKFLNFFGLRLPCRCDGLFGSPSSSHCLRRELVDRSIKRISCVQRSAKEKFPFDTMWEKQRCYSSSLTNPSEANYEERQIRLEGEASYSSCSGLRWFDAISGDLIETKEHDGSVNLLAQKGREILDCKGTKSAGQRPRSTLRRRCPGVVTHGKFSGPSNDFSRVNVEDGHLYTSTVCEMGNDRIEDGRETWTDYHQQETVSLVADLDNAVDFNKCSENGASSAEDFGFFSLGEACFDIDQRDIIRVLEQELDEEHTARAALLLELEKERSAAATAADEAMAMILRLQGEKASIEMEARQYKRMIEEKTAYDAEEMNILKEILLRRERELHFLEKEVEAYRKTIFSDDQMDNWASVAATPEQREFSSPYLPENLNLRLQRSRASDAEKREVKDAISSSRHQFPSTKLQNLTLDFGEGLPIPQADELIGTFEEDGGLLHPISGKCFDLLGCSDETYSEYQEKGTVAPDERRFTAYREADKKVGLENNSEYQEKGTITPHEIRSTAYPEVAEQVALEFHEFNSVNALSLPEKSSISIVEEEKGDSVRACLGLEENSAKISDGNGVSCLGYDGDECGDDFCQMLKDLPSSVVDKGPHVHDVHLIENEAIISSEANKKFSGNVTSSVPVNSGSIVSLANLQITRRSLDAATLLPAMTGSPGENLLGMRRNSLSATDYERLRIGTEIEWLRERLKIIQKEREKLNFSRGCKEKEKQFQLLEDLMSRLRQNRPLTEPGNAPRQMLLPPQFSKGASKERSWGSSSSIVDRSI